MFTDTLIHQTNDKSNSYVSDEWKIFLFCAKCNLALSNLLLNVIEPQMIRRTAKKIIF